MKRIWSIGTGWQEVSDVVVRAQPVVDVRLSEEALATPLVKRGMQKNVRANKVLLSSDALARLGLERTTALDQVGGSCRPVDIRRYIAVFNDNRRRMKRS